MNVTTAKNNNNNMKDEELVPMFTTTTDCPVKSPVGTMKQPLPRVSTGLVHCVVKHEKSTAAGRFGGGVSSTTRLTFSLQPPSEYEDKEILIMSAEKISAHSYVLYDEHHGQKKIGTLHRTQNGPAAIVYALYWSDVQVATVLYTVPSLVKVVREGPARQAQLALTSFDDTGAATTTKKQDPHWFAVACQESIKKTSTLDLMTAVSDVYESAVPYVKKDGRYGMDFKGRGRMTSTKNMQLVSPDSDPVVGKKKKIKCQVAKWDADVFHVDFCAPLTMFHAFGFALAQIDL
jgi:hypothetical protein